MTAEVGLRASRRHRFVLAVMAILLVAAGQAWLLHSKLPRAQDSAAVTIGGLLDDPVLRTRPPADLLASELCERWTGRPTIEVDCRTGKALDPQQQPSGEAGSSELLERARQQGTSQVQWLTGVRTRLAQRASEERSLLPVIAALDSRLQNLSQFSGSAAASGLSSPYTETFEGLLALEGVSYNALSGRFQLRRWDVMRLLDTDSPLKKRAERQAESLAFIPLGGALGALLVMSLGYWRAGAWGLLCTGLFSGLSMLGLLITADAAVNFGRNSLIYPLNPLGALLERQGLIVALGHGLVASLLLLAPVFSVVASWLLRHHVRAVWVVAAAVVAAYALGSPALGSESLKLGLALLAGCLLVDQGRVLHLVRKYAPRVLRPVVWPRVLFRRPAVRRGAEELVISHVAWPLINFSLFGFLVVGLAALLFQDLGGALVGSMMLVLALFLTFGMWPALISLSAMGLAALGLAFTDKVQARIQLMVEPMTAAVSDFARLIAFSQSAQPSGYGLGNLRWCNAEGVCLPLQVLSDYMPTLLGGVGGLLGAQAVFITMILLFLATAGRAFWQLLTQSGSQRLMAVTAGFLLIASLLQTIITFLGNWRLIPLTGLGVPLLSIGLSSMLAPSVALGLLLGAQFKPTKKL